MFKINNGSYKYKNVVAVGYCDADILLNKIHCCTTVYVVCDYIYIYIQTFRLKVSIQKDQVPVLYSVVSRVGECCV